MWELPIGLLRLGRQPLYEFLRGLGEEHLLQHLGHRLSPERRGDKQARRHADPRDRTQATESPGNPARLSRLLCPPSDPAEQVPVNQVVFCYQHSRGRAAGACTVSAS